MAGVGCAGFPPWLVDPGACHAGGMDCGEIMGSAIKLKLGQGIRRVRHRLMPALNGFQFGIIIAEEPGERVPHGRPMTGMGRQNGISPPRLGRLAKNRVGCLQAQHFHRCPLGFSA